MCIIHTNESIIYINCYIITRGVLYSYVAHVSPIHLYEHACESCRLANSSHEACRRCLSTTANLRTNIMDFRGFDSNTILMLRGGIAGPMGNLPESLSQAILVGIMLVGKLGVTAHLAK